MWSLQGGGQAVDPAAVAADPLDAPAHALEQEVEGAAGAEHADGDQHRDQVGDDRHRHLEAFLGALDEGLVERLAAASGQPHEGDDDGEDQEVRHHRRLARE